MLSCSICSLTLPSASAGLYVGYKWYTRNAYVTLTTLRKFFHYYASVSGARRHMVVILYVSV